MDYDEELALAKSSSIEDGITEEEYLKWDYRSTITINKIGFKSGHEVRRIALKFGKFVK